jgi:hypothetical protein
MKTAREREQSVTPSNVLGKVLETHCKKVKNEMLRQHENEK